MRDDTPAWGLCEGLTTHDRKIKQLVTKRQNKPRNGSDSLARPHQGSKNASCAGECSVASSGRIRVSLQEDVEAGLTMQRRVHTGRIMGLGFTQPRTRNEPSNVLQSAEALADSELRSDEGSIPDSADNLVYIATLLIATETMSKSGQNRKRSTVSTEESQTKVQKIEGLPRFLDKCAQWGADCNSDHYLVIGELRERLSVAKRVEQQVNITKFNILKLKDEEAKQNYQVEISNRFATLESSDEVEKELDVNSVWENIRDSIKIAAEQSIGYYETKKKKPWFDEDCCMVVERRKQAKLKFLQDPVEEKRDNYFNERREASRTLRNKREVT
ncbi:hypothetical protein ANN_13261 [Periplaneta americana]|uniref:Uncharacterized protein n=1 Tax=Periplaneta americana TaxID=6978 RepID=A0ABQ8TJE3_PERAM|nr:hypothetical protein ANN_13261 [Periplaneta americana]